MSDGIFKFVQINMKHLLYMALGSVKMPPVCFSGGHLKMAEIELANDDF